MKKIKTQNKVILVLKVPEDSHDFKLKNYKAHTVLKYISEEEGNVSINDGDFNVILNDCEILGKLSEIFEECFDLVQKSQERQTTIWHYWNYIERDWSCKSAKESLTSLLQVNDLDCSNPKTLLLIEKK